VWQNGLQQWPHIHMTSTHFLMLCPVPLSLSQFFPSVLSWALLPKSLGILAAATLCCFILLFGELKMGYCQHNNFITTIFKMQVFNWIVL